MKRLKIKDRMLYVTVLFISLLAILVDAFVQGIILDTMERNIYKNINGVCKETVFLIKQNYPSDFYVSDGQLYAGDEALFSDFDFLEALKSNFDAEISIFYKNVRYLTTIRDESGRRLVLTSQDEQVILDTVFAGNTYQAKDVPINGGKYYGVYYPLEDSSGDICGMVFAGISTKTVVRTQRMLLLAIVLISVCLCAVIVFIVSLFTNRLCRDLECIRVFLDRLSRNEMNVCMDERLLRRHDEVGELGVHSVEISRNIIELMNKDPLTQLYNRRSGEQLLGALCHSLALPGGRNLTFVMGDIDFFKRVNDTFGHGAGDSVLVCIAKTIESCCPKPDLAIRWGGEEFLLILNKDKDGAVATLDKIRNELAAVLFPGGEDGFHVTMTFGVAIYKPGEDYQQTIRRADKNLYTGKEGGRDCIITD